MKLIALTAALALGGAAYAQDMSTQTPPAGGGMAQTAPAPMNEQPATATGATETPGGYMPSTPPMSGTPQAGAPVRVQASMSPTQAFPPPAPKAEYPVCKRGQTDGCRQRGE
ncbi:hypothetical protein [Sphingomonas sp.]|uniref:hypothetical protein n=1 Tax=Sphingomonas sp. TaxID=28214 RepID=UPI002D130513|nr:hypothetical protein [Sphingomonas sp.]HTG37844.1 hypothetical protein [Sphingomonas sp.]